MRDATHSTVKTIQTLEKRVEAGDYYEAQQTYKARHARFVAARKYDDALELLQSGACIQLKHGQVTCGTELGVLLVETFRKASVPFGQPALDRILVVYREFPQLDVSTVRTSFDSNSISEDSIAARTRVEGCTTFLKAAIKWSIDSGGHSRGEPELHHMLANYIWTQSPVLEFGRASLYYIRGNCPQDFSRAVVVCMGKCYPSEVDLVIARAVFQYLSLGYLREASVLWDTVKEISAENFPDSPLSHFVYFLLQSLHRNSLPLFKMLRQTYKRSLDRDPSFSEYLDDVAEHFFNVQPRKGMPGMSGMFGDFMKMFGDS